MVQKIAAVLMRLFSPVFRILFKDILQLANERPRTMDASIEITFHFFSS